MTKSRILCASRYLTTAWIWILSFSNNACCDELQRIGLITALTGPVSPHGRAALDGFKLGLQSKGCEEKMQLIVEDDGFDPKRSVLAAQKLLNKDKAQVLLAVGSGPSHALSPVAEQHKTPLLVLAGDASVAIGHPFTIRLRPPAKYEGMLIAQLAYSENAKSVVLVCSSNEFTLAICDALSSQLGDRVLLREDLLPEETEFKTLIAKIRQLRPTHLIPILMPGKLGLFARQSKELQLNIPFLGGVFFESTSDFESSNGALNGSKYIMPAVSDEFRKTYESLPSASPGSIAWASVFFDTGQLLCLAKSRGVGILEYFKTIKGHAGSSGVMDYQDEGGDRFLRYPFVEKIILGGKFLMDE